MDEEIYDRLVLYVLLAFALIAGYYIAIKFWLPLFMLVGT